MGVRLVIFDLDGTLVDSMELYAEKAADLISCHYGVDRDEAKRVYLQTSGIPFIDQLEILFPGNPVNRKVAEIFERWKGSLVRDLKMDPEGADVIRTIKSRNITTAVSSNNLQRYVEEIVKSAGVEPDFILGWDGENFKKGEPHIRFLEERTHIPRENFLMVGDSPNDLKIARGCGINFIALTRGFSEEEFKSIDPNVKTIRKLRDLLSLIE